MVVRRCPAGYSAAGQPCDQIHGLLGQRIMDVISLTAGQAPNIYQRPDEYSLTAAGNQRGLKAIEVAQSDVLGWRSTCGAGRGSLQVTCTGLSVSNLHFFGKLSVIGLGPFS